MNDNTSVLTTPAPPTLFYERHHYPRYKTGVTVLQMNTQGLINSSFPLLLNGFHSFLMYLQLLGAARCGAQLGRWMGGGAREAKGVHGSVCA